MIKIFLNSRLIVFCFLLFIIIHSIYAEEPDSNNINDILKGFKFNIKGGVHYLGNGYWNPYDQPEYFKKIKYNSYDRTSDCPLYHGAAFTDFKLTYKGYGFTLSPELIIEHRGTSYGVYRKKALVTIPKYNFAFDSSFSLLGELFSTGISTGNYDNLKMYEGLQIYNIDVQGTHAYLNWKHFTIWYNKIGDLLFGPGLNINDLTSLGFTFEKKELFKNWNLKIESGIDNYGEYEENSPIKALNNISIALYDSNYRIYTQFAYKPSDKIDKLNWKSAFLAGVNFKSSGEKYSINTTLEYRYYGYYFNMGFSGLASYSVEQDKEGYSSIYPIQLYQRPFSQWAVFTEYRMKNVYGIIFQLEGKYFVYESFQFNAMLDINYIRSSNEKAFVYPFIDYGIAFEPIRNCFVKYSFTNKTMNLDKTYMTFYLLKEFVPYMSIQFEF